MSMHTCPTCGHGGRMTLELSDQQISTLAEACRIAAERYREHNQMLRDESKKLGGHAGYTALADQFFNQEQRAADLRDLLESLPGTP